MQATAAIKESGDGLGCLRFLLGGGESYSMAKTA